MERPKGTPVKRDPGAALPCWNCPKIPKGKAPRPANAVELTEQSWRIYDHYLRCRAVGKFPDDPLVEKHAAILRAVEDQCNRAWGFENLLTVAQVFGVKKR